MKKHPYPAGTRVHNRGEQWSEARQEGTATVLRAVPQNDGTFEYEVRRDKPTVANVQTTWWASYSTYLAEREMWS